MSDSSDFQQQLTIVNGLLEKSCEGPERDELLSLKNNIEELLALTAGPAGNDKADQNKSDTYSDAFDEEYALFMAEISKEDGPSVSKTGSFTIKELEGKKFKAPYTHSWGQTVYHNAMVCSVHQEEEEGAGDFKVKVMFLNPTHIDMLPCPYYLNIETDCRFSEAECKFSHGELVSYSSLQEYIEPKFEHLHKGDDVLAKQPDGLWYRGKIEELSGDKCVIRYDSKNKKKERFEELSIENILPLQESDDSIENESDEGSDGDEEIAEDSTDAAKEHRDILINKSLMITPDTVPLGEWEQHTKGIGSKLMQKMGYIVGTGLGKDGEGLVTPVSAQVLPKGKSLDFCMNLKEQQNNPDLFKAGNKVPRRIKKVKYSKPRQTNQGKVDVKNMTLDQFIMWYFFRSKVPVEEKESQLLREKLKVATLNDLNKAKFKIDERIKTITEAIAYLKTSIQRIGKHTDPLDLVRKLTLRENDLKRLNNFKLLSQNESDRRKNNKQMSVF